MHKMTHVVHTVIMAALSGAAVSFCQLQYARAATVETTNFISSPAYFNGFEGIAGSFYPENVVYSEGGVSVKYVSPTFRGIIATQFEIGEGARGWYPFGGGFGFTDIILSSGNAISAVQFLANSGFGDTTYLQYQLLNKGVVVQSGVIPGIPIPTQPYIYLGFTGGGFDEVQLKDQGASNVPFDPNGFEALTIDSISIVSQTPLPAAFPVFAGTLGVISLLARRKVRRAEVTA